MPNTIEELATLINELKVNLPKEVDETVAGGRTSAVSKALNIRTALLYRAYDLSNSSCKIIDESLISGKLLARGLLETSAMLAYLNLKIEKFIETKDIKEFDSRLMQLLVGSRIHEEPTSINIMTAIESVGKQCVDLKGFKDYFETLCEFAHPNFSGTNGSFGSLKDGKTTYHLKPEDFEQQKQDTINALCFGLRVLKYFSLEIYENTDNLVETYNSTIIS